MEGQDELIPVGRKRDGGSAEYLVERVEAATASREISMPS